MSAFADNSVLFAAIAMVMKNADSPGWYVPALQGSFLVAFVVLAPWVGYWANRYPKSRLLIIANIIKAIGTVLLLVDLEPIIAYALVGVGAALYSPAKYGILPEIAPPDNLVKVNGLIEGSTILAILSGMLIGSKVADQSLTMALAGSACLYVISAAIAVAIPVIKGCHRDAPVKSFIADLKHLTSRKRAMFTLIGTALFWSTSAVLRVILIAWCPIVLQLMDVGDIAQLTLFLAIGIMCGAAVVPKLVNLANLNKVRFAAYFMSVLIVLLGLVSEINMARVLLFAIGVSGGFFIVPINAALQDEGHDSVGSGSAVALQNFFENLAMLASIGGYAYLSSMGLKPISAIYLLGTATLAISLAVVAYFPELRKKTSQAEL